jgi:hypothetical protein
MLKISWPSALKLSIELRHGRQVGELDSPSLVDSSSETGAPGKSNKLRWQDRQSMPVDLLGEAIRGAARQKRFRP